MTLNYFCVSAHLTENSKSGNRDNQGVTRIRQYIQGGAFKQSDGKESSTLVCPSGTFQKEICNKNCA
jgi:hypothetical protein